MRYTLAPVFLLGLFVACGGGDDNGYGTDGGGGGPKPDSSKPGEDAYSSGDDSSNPPDTGTGTGAETGTGTDEGGTTCTSLKCTSDSECQTACGPVSGGVECCDTATQVCFSTPSSTCPVSTGSGSDGGGGY